VIGTGKTNTLVALLQSLVASNLRVHATAPTNVAVSELASRFLSASPHLRLADILLVGTKERLNVLDEENPLDMLLLDSRIERFENAEQNLHRYISSFTAFIRRIKPPKEQYDKEDTNLTVTDSNDGIGTAFLYVMNELLGVITFLHRELPVGVVQHLDEEDFKFVLETFQIFLQASDKQILEWLEGDKNNTFCNYSNRVDDAIDILRRITVRKELNTKIMFIKEAAIVFSTVNVSGRELFQYVHFDIVVVDEATQLVEAETAILLREQLKCMVLAGDDKQLPATVMSPACQKMGYGRSLFSRLLSLNYPYSLLNIQYRMHPSISRWPRAQFYSGEVLDGPNVTSTAYNKMWHEEFPPFVIYSVNFGLEESSAFGSKYNEAEAIVVRQLIGRIRANNLGTLSIGVISPYSEQVSILSHLITTNAEFSQYKSKYC